MPSAARLASLVALVAPLVSSSGCVCPGSPLFQCYHRDATEGASDSDSTQTGSATETTGATMGTGTMSMSQSTTMAPDCNMNARCDEGESVVLCPEECKACGNGEVDEGEVCDEGEANSKDNAYHDGTPETAPCNSSCTGKVPFCGDAICQLNEDTISCAQDGCTPTCGNGVMEAGEDCDDGNLENTDACLNNCKAASCGDGFIEAGVEECDDTNLSDNDACTNACKMAICGDGLTWVGTEECDDANAVETDACDMACKTVVHRKVFVSSGTFPGNLGGLVGADAKCQMLADAKDLAGNYQAWLSDGAMGPGVRFDTAFTGVYELVDGTRIAHGWMDLSDGALEHAIDLDETNNAMAVDATVWSNAGIAGSSLGAVHCGNWSSSSGMTAGAYGFSSSVDSKWTNSGDDVPCNSVLRLYCFEDPA
ncbi:MAG: DUF4215 domain-containing protein [Myxococcales bacterium]|nr:DUF4215 domain-containing protein [Myxococcales bacterium]